MAYFNGLERDLAPATPSFGDDAVGAYGTFVPTEDEIMHQSVQWGTNVLEKDTSFGASMSKIWQEAEKSAAAAVATTESILVTTGIVIGALNTLGATALATVLTTLLTDIISYIMTALTLGAVTTIAGAAAIGSAGGYIGTIIGAIVGAIIAGVSIVTGGPKVQITNGNWFSAQDYAKVNVPNAVNWLKSATTDQLMYLTPLHFSNQANLFLANPVWLYLNQNWIYGRNDAQPPPPEYGSGSILDIVYSQIPGAFELLNRVHLLTATAMVNTNPARLPFFSGLYHPSKDAVGILKTMGLAGASGVAAETHKGIWPNPNPLDYMPAVGLTPASQGTPSMAINSWQIGSSDVSFVSGWKGWNWFGQNLGLTNVPKGSFSLYSACPHLATNETVFDASGKIVGQSDICEGIYMLQVMFPSLTTAQCDAIFLAATPAYNKVYNAAHTWALSQKFPVPKTTDLGAGSKYNLTTPDVAVIIADWKYANQVHGVPLPPRPNPPKPQPVAGSIAKLGASAPPKKSVPRSNVGLLAAVAAAASIGGFVALRRRA